MRALAWAGRALVGLALLEAGSVASAQERPSVTVLGLTTEGPDDTLVAENMTSVLRRAVEEDRSVRPTGQEATLAQMSLAFGCEDQRDATCLRQIGQEVQSDRLISGSVTRTTRDADWAYRIDVWLFDVQAGRELAAADAQVGRTSFDIDDLRDVARRLVRRLMGGETGRLDVRTEVDGARVHVDGERAGVTSDGHLVIEDVGVGEHHLAIEADGYEAYETTVTVHPGETAQVRTRLVETGAGAGGGGGEPPDDRREDRGGGGMGPLQWVGVGALVAGAVLGVVAVSWAVDVDTTDASASWAEYRHRYRDFDASATSACDVRFADEDRDEPFDGHLGKFRSQWELGVDGNGRPLLPQGRHYTAAQLDDMNPATITYNDNGGETLRATQIESVCMHRTGQWVMGGLAVTAGLVGTYLLFGTGDDDPPRRDRAGSEDGDAHLQLMPIVSSEQRGLGLRLTF